MHSGIKSEFGFDTYYACDVYRPLIDWSTEQVFEYIKSKGQHRNPLYDIGAMRVGCFPCIMSRKSEIRLIADKFPERIDMIRQWEGIVRHGDGAHFFPIKMAHREYSTKKMSNGQRYASIDDVVKWAHTSRGGKQYDFNFDEPPTCANESGACE